MMRALFSGVSGLKNHQLRMDVVANNIANVNTVGFKASRALFTEAMTQVLRGAGAPQGNRGGTNPLQVGLGVAVASVDADLSPGSTQNTGVNSDLAIQGNGYFIADSSNGSLYTRAGALKIDRDGYLTLPGGYRVMGWQADNTGTLPAAQQNNLVDLRVPSSTTLPAKASTEVTFTGNLDAATPAATTITRDINVFDSLGNPHKLLINLSSAGPANEWQWTVTDTSGNLVGGSATPVVFNPDGTFNTAGAAPSVTYTPGGGANPITLALDFSGLTQYAGETTTTGTSDGYASGTLVGYSFDPSGTVTGIFSNERKLVLGQVALATFTNPGGLTDVGGGMFQQSGNSGNSNVGAPGTGMRGTVAPGALEMANVDLAQQFTDMITTERGFQSNARVITTADEMLQELANLKR